MCNGQLLLRNCKIELMFSTASKTANLRQNTGKVHPLEFLPYYRTAPLSLALRRGADCSNFCGNAFLQPARFFLQAAGAWMLSSPFLNSARTL